MKQVNKEFQLIFGYDGEIGIQFHDLFTTIWLDSYEWSNCSLITPEGSYILVEGGWGSSFQDILNVEQLKKEAIRLIKNVGGKASYYHTSFKGISTKAEWNAVVYNKQSGHLLEIVNSNEYYNSYYKFDLTSGKVLEYYRLFDYHEKWALAVIDRNLFLMNVETRQQFQLTQDCGIYTAYLNSRSSYCLISCGALIMYYLKPPFTILTSPLQEAPHQWKSFPLFNYEMLHTITPKEEEFVFEMGIDNTPNIVFNIKTGAYYFEENEL